MATKVQRQNNLAGMVNTEQTKQKALQQRAELAMERIKENKDRIHENRCRVDGFGDYAVKFHDSIQSISCEISGLDEELRQFRAREGELVKLNVALASAETELREVSKNIAMKSRIGKKQNHADPNPIIEGSFDYTNSNFLLKLNEYNF